MLGAMKGQRVTAPISKTLPRDLHNECESLQRKLMESGSMFQRLLDDAQHTKWRFTTSAIQFSN
jgi:hypothetical protein